MNANSDLASTPYRADERLGGGAEAVDFRISTVVVGQGHDIDSSEEFRWGWRLLQGLWSPDTPVLHTAADSLDAVARLVACDLPAQDDGAAPVLLLRHPHVLLSPASLAALKAALDEGAAAACAWDTTQPSPAGAPDYCTLGGLHRYERQLRLAKAADADPRRVGAHEPLVALVRRSALPGLIGRWAEAAWPQAAHVHPYADYRDGERREVLPLVPSEARRVLDVGGGAGRFLKALKADRHALGHAIETHLAEADAAACAQAAGAVDHVWPGDYFHQRFEQGGEPLRFDCISFLDVLEHVTEPLPWLQRARALLSPSGCVVTSIPNVGHWSVIADLLEGRWDYAPVGIHCITHLRFYTRSGIEQLMAQAGLRIEHLEPVPLPAPAWFQPPALAERVPADAPGWHDYAYLVRARPVEPLGGR